MRSKFKWIFTLLLALTVQFSFAQEKTITGVVSDASGPLPGVNVVIKGTTKGVSTGFDGSYSIKAKEGDVLVYSFMGMNDVTKTVAASNVINTILQSESKKLTEVVVTALGVKREKKSLGYATQEVKGDVLRSAGNTGNVVSSLTGKAAGVQIVNSGNFGGSSSIVVRGMKSIQGNNQALIVIDGVPVNNSNLVNSYTSYDGGNTGSDINPNDIESVNVLKGAAASALYGERANAGVVVITTKKGKTRKDNSWGVSYNSEVQFGNIDKKTFVEYQDKYGAGYGSNNYAQDGFDLADVDGDGIDDLVAPTYDDASLGAAFDPSLMVYQWDSFDPTSKNYGKKTPWVAAKSTPVDYFETSLGTNNSISLEKSNEVSSILLNYTNYKTTGVLPNSHQDKNTISSKFSYNITDKLTANVYSSLTFQNTIGRNITGYNDNIITGFRQWWQTNVDINEQRDAYFRSYGANNSWNIKGYSKPTEFYKSNFWNNPYFDRYQSYQSDNRTRFFGYASLVYKLSKSINLTGRVSSDFWNQKDESRMAVGATPTTFGVSALNVNSGYLLGNSNSNETNYDLFADFNKKFANDFSINALLGTSYRKNINGTAFASTEGGLIVPGLYALRNTKSSPLSVQETEAKSSLMSAYAQLSLGYLNTYFIEGTGRGDVSSNLPKDKNKYFYPSVSGSIVLSNIINQDWLSFLKVRANWAQVGKSTDNYRIKDTYSIAGLYGTTPIVNPRTFKNNAFLKPEISTEKEVGLEAKFFNNRFGFDISGYQTISRNQILRVDASTASGYAQTWINAGSLENKGFEAQLNVTPVRSEKFNWDFNVNWAMNKNKVIELAPGIHNLLLGTGVGSVTFNAKEGQPYGTILGTDYLYSPNGERIINPATGRYRITSTRDNVLGNIMPEWTASIRNNISYNKISLSFLVDGQKGGSIYSGDMYYGTGTGIHKGTVAIREPGYTLGGVVPDGAGGYKPNTTPIVASSRPENTGHIISSANYANKEFVYDASFVKLREAALSYALPEKWFNDKLNASVGVFGRNLWVIYKALPYADPEAGTSVSAASVQSNNLARGYSIGAMPTTRVIGASLNVKF